ncbi:YcaO-like family protein, partial [Streptococcus danieliae]|nr:YcaO-like family protein [Streptococcus danieliae]
DLKGTLFPISSNGAGSAVVLEDAILHGLLEAVERDAWIIGQSNPFVLPIVDYETSKNSKIKDIGHL